MVRAGTLPFLAACLLSTGVAAVASTGSSRVPTPSVRSAAAPTPLTAKPRPAPLALARSATAATLRAVRPVLGTNRWLFSYADLRPYTDVSPEGLAFLATNLGFLATGAVVGTSGGAPALGLLLELAGTFSIGYHWSQCRLGGTRRPLVQLAILLDYAFAVPSVLGGLWYAAALGSAVPLSAIALAAASLVCLALGWVYDGPRSYMVVHGLWHLLGCAAGYQLALAHQLVVGM
jgi:hypothetical protein